MSLGSHTKKQILSSLLICGLSISALNACTPVSSQRGNMVQDFTLQEIQVGQSTKSDVMRTLGSPTTKSPFDENTWYYMGQKKEKRGILDPKVVEERIIVASFNADGVLDTLQDVSPERIDVPLADSKTPTYGNEASVLQEFFGNLGKFNPQTDE